MKSVIISKEEKKEEKPFPKLVISKQGDELILLVTGNREGGVWLSGTVFHTPDSVKWPIGDYNKAWDASQFTDFDGTIQLSND